MFVIFLIVGFFLIIYGIYKLFNVKNPFEKITSSIDSIQEDKKEDKEATKKEEPSPKTIPKSEIPLDKDSYKIGEFDMDDIKKGLKKPTNSKKPVEEDINDIPPARERQPKKDIPAENVENEEYKQAKLKYESIDDIFAEVEDIEDIDIISIDSKEEK
jgi:cytoskeletal protein RodZ